MEILKEQYQKEVVPALMKKFNYKSVMEVPKLEKIVINVGLGDMKDNPKALDNTINDLKIITGQTPIVTKAKKVLARCEKDGRNAGPSCIIDRPFLIDLLSFTPVYKEENCVTCPYCSASYKEEANGKVCAVCGVAQIGLKTLGLVCRKQ